MKKVIKKVVKKATQKNTQKPTEKGIARPVSKKNLITFEQLRDSVIKDIKYMYEKDMKIIGKAKDPDKLYSSDICMGNASYKLYQKYFDQKRNKNGW